LDTAENNYEQVERQAQPEKLENQRATEANRIAEVRRSNEQQLGKQAEASPRQDTSDSVEAPENGRRLEQSALTPDEVAGMRRTREISNETKIGSTVEAFRGIDWLEPEKWRGLDSVERRIALDNAGKELMHVYECPAPPLLPKEFPEYDGRTLLGFYEDGASIRNPEGDYGISLSERLMSYTEPREALEAYCHEFRHAYQHEMAGRYEKPEFQNMVHDLDLAAEWNESFRNYKDGPPEWMDQDDPRYAQLFNQYQNQAVERDARQFSQNIVTQLYERVG